MQSLDREPRLGVIIPAGKHIAKAVLNHLEKQGLDYDLTHNGAYHGLANNARASLTLLHSRDVLGRAANAKSPAIVLIGSERLEDYQIRSRQGIVDEDGQRLPPLEEVHKIDLFHPRLRVNVIVQDATEDRPRAIYTIQELANHTLATSYIGLAGQFLNENGITGVTLQRVTGHEEALVDSREEEADAAMVVVDSGGTVKDNHCVELEPPYRTQLYVAVACNPRLFMDQDSRKLLEEFIHGLQDGFAPKEVAPVLPGRFPSFGDRVKQLTAGFFGSLLS